MAAQVPYGKRTGFTSLRKAVRVSCRLVRTYGARVREFIPSSKLTVYDAGVTAIDALCTILDEIDTLKLDANDTE